MTNHLISQNNILLKNNYSKLPHLLLFFYLILFVICAIHPYIRAVWWAENIPVMIVVILLIGTYHKFQFSNTSYLLMWFFLSFHTIGGHYTFELVPFERFNELLSRLHFDFLFPYGRNNFDRVGHFLVGVFAFPLAEFTYRMKFINSLYVAAVFGILALGFWGAVYEGIEMIYAIKQGGDSGAAFLGSQGDDWDAQKDMLLDIYGAISAGILFIIVWRKAK
jgi:putative membrane protein